MPRRVLEGSVVSAKNDKTITVLVERRFMHPVYKKYIKNADKFTAHDEANQYKEGDRVSIIECRPISKSKRWTVVTGDENASSKEVAPKAAKEKTAPAKKKEEPKKEKEAPVKEKKAATKKPAAKKKTTKATKKDA